LDEAGNSLPPAANISAICLRIESVTLIEPTARLTENADETGAGSVQLSAQHNLAIVTLVELSRCFALGQQFIIPAFSSCIGMPESTPPARAKITKNDANHLFILTHQLYSPQPNLSSTFKIA